MANIAQTYANTGGNAVDVSYLARIARRIIIVPLFGNDYSENTIATVAGITKSALQLKCNEHDVKDRYYPLPNLENVESVRAESTMHEWNSGTKEFVKEGVKPFTGIIKCQDGGPALLKNLKKWRGGQFGCYIIDRDGNFHYMLDSGGVIVKPLPIAGGSWDATEIDATDSEPFMLKIMFDFAPELDYGDVRYEELEDLDFDGRDYNQIYGLWDVYFTAVSDSLTTIVLDIATDYRIPITGLVVADFYLYNDTDSGEVVPSAVVETVGTPGRYTLTVGAQTQADAFTLRLNKSKYDYNDTISGTFTA